MGNQL